MTDTDSIAGTGMACSALAVGLCTCRLFETYNYWDQTGQYFPWFDNHTTIAPESLLRLQAPEDCFLDKATTHLLCWDSSFPSCGCRNPERSQKVRRAWLLAEVGRCPAGVVGIARDSEFFWCHALGCLYLRAIVPKTWVSDRFRADGNP